MSAPSSSGVAAAPTTSAAPPTQAPAPTPAAAQPLTFQRDPNLDSHAGKVTFDGGSNGEAPVIHLKMQNIMASVNLCTRVDLDKITQTARNAEYNPKRFQAVIMRIREPRTTALIFASGKMIITGARSEEAASVAGKKYVAIVQKVRQMYRAPHPHSPGPGPDSYPSPPPPLPVYR